MAERKTAEATQEGALDLCLQGNAKASAGGCTLPGDPASEHFSDSPETDDDTESSETSTEEDDDKNDSGLGSSSGVVPLDGWFPNPDVSPLSEVFGARLESFPFPAEQPMDYSTYLPDFSDMCSDSYHFWQMEDGPNSNLPNFNVPSSSSFYHLPYGTLVSDTNFPVPVSEAEIRNTVTHLPPISSAFPQLGQYGSGLERFCEDIVQQDIPNIVAQEKGPCTAEFDRCESLSKQNSDLPFQVPRGTPSVASDSNSGFTHCSSGPFSSYVPHPVVSANYGQSYQFGMNKRNKTVRELLQERLNLAYTAPWALTDCLPSWPLLGEDSWSAHCRYFPWMSTAVGPQIPPATLQNPLTTRVMIPPLETTTHSFQNVLQPGNFDIAPASFQAEEPSRLTSVPSEFAVPATGRMPACPDGETSAAPVSRASTVDPQQKVALSQTSPTAAPSTSPKEEKPDVRQAKLQTLTVAKAPQTPISQPLKVTRVIPLQQSQKPLDPTLCKVVSILPKDMQAALARIGSVVGRPRTNLPSAAVRPCNVSATTTATTDSQVCPSMVQKDSMKDANPPAEKQHHQRDENEQPQIPPPLKLGRVDAKEHRPRHYDMERLEIGNFVVETHSSPNGKSLNKFKVIFSKRRFVYEFEVANPPNSSPASGRRPKTVACLVVPFRTVVGLKCDSSLVQVLLDTQPAMYLGLRHVRVGIIASVNVYDTAKCVDITNGAIKSCRLHQVTLKKYQADKLKVYLWHFDARFRVLTQIPLCDPGTPPSQPAQPAGDDLVKQPTCKKVTRRRNAAPWRQTPSSEETSTPSTCSCRVSCRSVRCSCTKVFRKCNANHTTCQCSNCDNPINILEEFGVDLPAAMEDKCLLQNIHRFLGLRLYLTQTLLLNCCGHTATVKECIPGTVACPNSSCKALLEYSWCRSCAYNVSITSRNHCDICRRCCLSLEKHCPKCNRCFLLESGGRHCPRCKWNGDQPADSVAKGECHSSSVLFRVQITKPTTILPTA